MRARRAAAAASSSSSPAGPGVLPPPTPTSVLPPVWADGGDDAGLLGARDAARQRAESAGSSVYSAHGRQATGVAGDQGVGVPQASAAGSVPGLAI